MTQSETLKLLSLIAEGVGCLKELQAGQEVLIQLMTGKEVSKEDHEVLSKLAKNVHGR